MIGLELIVLLKGVTYVDIAKHFGIKKQSVNDWVKKGVIPEQRLEELAEFLGCPKYFLVSKVNIDKMEEDLHKYLYL